MLRLTLDDKEVIHKVGMCYSDRATDRMMEILRSWFMQYRYIPETQMKLNYKTNFPYQFEKHIHGILNEFKWIPDKKVDGGQEMFKGIEEQEVIDYIKFVNFVGE